MLAKDALRVYHLGWQNTALNEKLSDNKYQITFESSYLSHMMALVFFLIVDLSI